MKMCPLNEKNAYTPKICLLKKEKTQLFGVFKCIRGINLKSHVVQ